MVTQTKQPALKLLFGLSEAELNDILERDLERLTAGARSPANLAQSYRERMGVFTRGIDEIRTVLGCTASEGRSYDSQANDIINEAMKGSGLAGILEIDPSMAKYHFGSGSDPMERWSLQYIWGVKIIATAFLPEMHAHHAFNSRHFPIMNHGGFITLSETNIQPSRYIPSERGLVPDPLSRVENYIAALDGAVEEQIVAHSESGVALQKFFEVAPNFSMNYLGVAKGLEVIAEHGGLDSERSQQALAMAKECYQKSGFAHTIFVASKLFDIGDPQSVMYVQIPQSMYASFMQWVGLGMPGREQA